MIDLELPLGRRSKLYRFFEIIPAVMSYMMLLLLIILSIVNPLWAALYLLLLIMTMFIKSIGIAFSTIRGHHRLVGAQKIDWHARLQDLEHPADAYDRVKTTRSKGFGYQNHQENLRLISADADNYPKPSQLYNAIIIAAYNESYGVLQPTIESVKDTTYDNKRIILYLAY